MNKIKVFLILFFPISLFAQIGTNINDLNFKLFADYSYLEQGYILKKWPEIVDSVTLDNNKELLNGNVFANFSNGKKYFEGKFKNGLPHGQWAEWNENGRLLFEARYKKGRMTGYFKMWNIENPGKIIKYSKGVKNGKLLSFFPNNKMSERRFYKNGLEYGSFESWHENGQIASKGQYKNGKSTGFWQQWHENGVIATTGYFENGKQNGLESWYNEKGQIYSQATFVNGQLNGYLREWHSNNQLGTEALYENGKLISSKCWDVLGNEIKCTE
jgi:antitoxin component YwqK of YwqJK toxin-antitoxin module